MPVRHGVFPLAHRAFVNVQAIEDFEPSILLLQLLPALLALNDRQHFAQQVIWEDGGAVQGGGVQQDGSWFAEKQSRCQPLLAAIPPWGD